MRSGEARAAVAWHALALQIALVAVPGWLTISLLISSIPVSMKLAVAAVLFTSVVSPAAGLLTVAAATPLGQFLTELTGLGPFRVSEAFVLAFLTGWLLRAQDDRRGPDLPSTIGWLLVCSIVGSIGGLVWQLSPYRGELARTFDVALHDYFRSDLLTDRLGLVDGARLLEGLALTAATVALFRQRPRLAEQLPAALTLAAAAAGAASLALWLGVVPAATLGRYARTGYRVSAHIADVNAAGSYFAMILCLALAMTVRSKRWHRVAWALAASAIGTGLWLSRSRTALAAAGVVMVVAATWYAMLRLKPAVRALAVGGALVAALAVMTFRVYQVNFGVDYRQQFYATSARMIQARPLFGVGVGQYYRTSPMFLSPQLAWNYGSENAHNNFLQIGAELGLVGLGLFVAWIGVGLARTAAALAIAPHDARLLGLAAGVTAFVATWLGSHPLLVAEVANPFWIQFGLTVALAGSTQLNSSAAVSAPSTSRAPRTWPRTAAALAAGLCVVVAATRLGRNPIGPPASADVDGFYGWETASDGTRFRWSRQFASLFVPADARRVRIPVRVPSELRMSHPLEVDVMIGGVFHNRATVHCSWATIEVGPPPLPPPTMLNRIDLKANVAWQPALHIPGIADLRFVGIQVGEIQLGSAR